MTTIRTELQKKAQSSLVQYALFRWEGATILAITLILATFSLSVPWLLTWWVWLLLGLAGYAAIVYTSLTDASANAKLLLRLFQEQFNPNAIRDQELRAELEQALEYQRRIEQQIRGQEESLMFDRLQQTANQITSWISNMYQLALRLDAYRSDDLLARERRVLPKELEDLSARRGRERNPGVRSQIETVLESKKQHLQALSTLDTRMKQAHLQMEQSLTALGTIYSQVQLIDSRNVSGGHAERLQGDIQEQVNRLDDLVSSINEVYDYQSKGLS